MSDWAKIGLMAGGAMLLAACGQSHSDRFETACVDTGMPNVEEEILGEVCGCIADHMAEGLSKGEMEVATSLLEKATESQDPVPFLQFVSSGNGQRVFLQAGLKCDPYEGDPSLERRRINQDEASSQEQAPAEQTEAEAAKAP